MKITKLFDNLKARGIGRAFNSNQLSSGRFAAVDWTGTYISVQQFNVADGQITSVGAAMHAQWPEAISPQDSTEAAGEWLAAELQRTGICATNAFVCVPRRDVSLKLLEFPVVDNEELAALVMLQVESRAEANSDEQTFDFLALPTESSATHRIVLVATIAKNKLDRIQQTLNKAGLNVRTTSVGELAIDALLPKQRETLSLSVLANHSKAEFVLSHHGCPVASHSVRMPTERPIELAQSVADICARLKATLPRSLAEASVRNIYLLGPNACVLFADVAHSCGGNVHEITTQCDNNVRCLSLITRLISNDPVINFLKPRRPTDTRVAQRRQLMRYAVCVAILCGLIGYWIHDRNSFLESQLATLKQDERDLQELNERGQTAIKAWQFVDQWQSSAADWSSELHAFSEQLPEPGQMYLTQLQLEQPAGTEQPVIRADGLAKENDIAMTLNRKLMASHGKYEIQPNGIEPSSRDSAFRSSFRVDATIHEPDRSK